jgi:hypothetical protein
MSITRIYGLVLLLLLSFACAGQPDTLVGETMTTAAPPTATATQTPTATQLWGVTVLAPVTTTPPAEPPATKTPAPIAIPDISRFTVLMSSQGQLAYLDDQSLYVEIPAGSGKFELLTQPIGSASWSPDGEKLLLHKWQYEVGTTDYLVWYAGTGELLSLKTSISGFPPQPTYDSGLNIYTPTCMQPGTPWLPDSQRILFQNLEDRSEGEPETTYASLTDLSNQKHTILAPTYPRSCVYPITNEIYLHILAYTNASVVEAITYEGVPLWDYAASFTLWENNSWESVGNQGVAFSMNTLPGTMPLRLEKIDVQTGDVALLWEDAEKLYQPYAADLILSPQGRYISFFPLRGEELEPTLHIIDIEGVEIGRFEQASYLFWRNEDGFIVDYPPNSDGLSSFYVSLEDGSEQPITPNPDRLGVWSPDGRYFIYEVVQPGNVYLYLWEVGDLEASLIWSKGNSGLWPTELMWHPDSNQLYVEAKHWAERDWQLLMFDPSNGEWRALAASTD